VGGKGVCRGYLNRVMLTGERFMTNPHRPGEIIYRSGDRVKRLENGEMEYLGRVDHQVKIRGFRIELGEIEHRLLEIPGIKAGVVIDRQEEGGNGERYLCAYFVSEQDISATGIRHRLAEKLPGYMVPAHFVRLPFIPLTANGKTDRGALPDPEIEAGEEYVPPDSDSERHLAAIWAEVLHLDPQVIGRKTNFFEIGGNSLKIYHLAEKLKEVFAREIPVVVLFEYPTIQDQALYLAGTAGDRAGEKAGEKAPAGREDAGSDRITRGREQMQGRRERLSKPGR
jgi:acyl carrier protein